MAAPPIKRRRADTAGRSEPLPVVDHLPIIESLPVPILRDILQAAAKKHPDVVVRILDEKIRLERTERSKTVDFDYLSKSAWKVLNVTYRKLKGSHQYDLAGEAESSVVGCIETISEGCPDIASYETKANALETLRKIGKTICLSGNDVIGHETIKSFQSETILEDSMLRIVNGMTDDELDDIMAEEWYDKLLELVDLSKGLDIMEGLSDVVAFLQGGESENGDDDDDGEDGDESGGDGDSGDENISEDASEGWVQA
ncbi:hypothetical protein MMC30_002069 [Trapelia coarctata]|nr:hypothetical protein [Trapelia coarctata]